MARSRSSVRALLALGVVALSSGCPARPKRVVYDLARQNPVAERWSARDVVLFGGGPAGRHGHRRLMPQGHP